MEDNYTFQDFGRVLKLKRYSQNTINIYTSLLRTMQRQVGEKPLYDLENAQVVSEAIKLVERKNYGRSSHKQLLGALSLYFKEMHRRTIDFSNIYPATKERKLPQILSKQEVQRLIELTTNEKHKTMLMCLYALGLRRSELINLKIKDIDSDRGVVHIKSAKGNKDRLVPLSVKLL